MKLVYSATQVEVKIGDTVAFPNGDKADVVSIEKPRHGGSTGRMYVRQPSSSDRPGGNGYYPGVFDAQWIEREDQQA